MSNLFSKPFGSSGGSSTDAKWGEITGDINSQSDLQSQFLLKQNLSDKGISNGYAPTDENNKIPAQFLLTENLTNKDLLFNENFISKDDITYTLEGTNVNLSWQSSDLDVEYQVFYSNGSIDFSSPQATVTQPNYTIVNLQPEATFTVYVKRVFDNPSAVKFISVPSLTGFLNSSILTTSDALSGDKGSVKITWTE